MLAYIAVQQTLIYSSHLPLYVVPNVFLFCLSIFFPLKWFISMNSAITFTPKSTIQFHLYKLIELFFIWRSHPDFKFNRSEITFVILASNQLYYILLSVTFQALLPLMHSTLHCQSYFPPNCFHHCTHIFWNFQRLCSQLSTR